jgi:hypothetical protein
MVAVAVRIAPATTLSPFTIKINNARTNKQTNNEIDVHNSCPLCQTSDTLKIHYKFFNINLAIISLYRVFIVYSSMSRCSLFSLCRLQRTYDIKAGSKMGCPFFHLSSLLAPFTVRRREYEYQSHIFASCLSVSVLCLQLQLLLLVIGR